MAAVSVYFVYEFNEEHCSTTQGNNIVYLDLSANLKYEI